MGGAGGLGVGFDPHSLSWAADFPLENARIPSFTWGQGYQVSLEAEGYQASLGGRGTRLLLKAEGYQASLGVGVPSFSGGRGTRFIWGQGYQASLGAGVPSFSGGQGYQASPGAEGYQGILWGRGTRLLRRY